MEYLAIPSLLISLGSIVIAWVSFQRTRIFQEYEYAPRLQLNDESATFSSPSQRERPALAYSAEIENRGSKPVEISRIYLDYGSSSDHEKRISYVVEGEMYLSSGQQHNIDVEVSWPQVEQIQERFNIDQAMFFLRVQYKNPNGAIEESTRGIGGFDGESNVSFAQRGTRLT